MIPCYKEAENLRKLIPMIQNIDPSAKIYLADDYSSDGTDTLSSLFGAIYVKCTERLFARALSKGLVQAFNDGCKLFIQMDADLSHDPKYIPEFIEALKENDVVLGIRLDKSKAFKSKFLEYRSSIANIIAKNILGLNNEDITTGYHGFNRNAIMILDPENWISNRFEVEVEIAYRSIKAGLKVAEVPIEFKDRTFGESKRNIREPIEFIFKCLEMRRGI